MNGMLLRFLPLSFLLAASICGRADKEHAFESPKFDKKRVKADLAFIAESPHPMGSARQKTIASHIEAAMQGSGLKVTTDAFTATVPDPEAIDAEPASMRRLTLDLPLQNVYAKLEVPGANCVLMLGSHYDSKRLEGGESLGANDSGSSSAMLLELMRSFTDMHKAKANRFRCSILAVWFDGEEAYLREWRDGEVRHPARIADHLYGSRYLAAKIKACKEQEGRCLPSELGGEAVQAMLLLDMIGMDKVRLTQELESDPALLNHAKKWDERLFKGELYKNSTPKPVVDDHIPFKEIGIPVLDLIDFENVETWHTVQDTPDRVSIDSMLKVGKLASALVQDMNRAD